MPTKADTRDWKQAEVHLGKWYLHQQASVSSTNLHRSLLLWQTAQCYEATPWKNTAWCSLMRWAPCKHNGSTVDCKTLITLNGGGQWTRNFRSYSAAMPNTSFNITGFIQPTFVEKMLLSDDACGWFWWSTAFWLSAWTWFPLWQVKRYRFHLNLQRFLADEHQTEMLYSFSSMGLMLSSMSMTRQESQDDVQGILSKARVYVARTAMILHCLKQAVSHALSVDVDWKCEIDGETFQAAAKIIDHLIN